MFQVENFSCKIHCNVFYNLPQHFAKVSALNALNITCSSNVASVLIFQAVKSSTTVVSSGVTGKRRPLSAHVSQPMPLSKPPPAFNTSKAKRQLDVIEKDLKLTTKALQDRLGISKQGFV